MEIDIMSHNMDFDILERINKSAARFLQPLTPEATYKVIIKEAIKLVEGDEGYIALVEDGDLKIRYAEPPSLGDIKMRKRGFSYRAFAQKKAFVTYVEDFKDIHPELVEAGIQSTIFIPLAHKNKSIGTMNIMSKHRTKRFTQKELSILKLFGSLASLAIRKSQLYSETKAALEARDLFLSMAAHEFRTPITTISGFTQLLRNKDRLNGTEKKWADEIYKEVNRLARLVTELLEVNRIRLGQFQYNWQECDLAKILGGVIEVFKISHPNRKLNFKTKTKSNFNIIGDTDKITQVLINILDNAAKFSPVDKPIEVSLKTSTDNLTIQIIDQGVGIAKQDLEKVFEGFYRGINNRKEGMGLGLYLSSEIIKEHRGKISIKSKINKGTTVEIIFPKTSIKS